MKKLYLIAALLLAGCAAPPPLTPEQVKMMEPVVCTSQSQCTFMWQRAQLWLVNNSAWKIQTANDTLLQTFGPGDQTEVAYTITREPISATTYRIVMRAACGNMFGCHPKSPATRIIEFNNDLRQFAGATERRVMLGVQYTPVNRETLAKMAIDADYGHVIRTISPGGLGERSGLRLGDVILKIDNIPVTSAENLSSLAQGWTAAKPGKLTVARRGEISEITITP